MRIFIAFATKVLSEYGFGAAMAVGLFVVFWFLLKWVMKNAESLQAQSIRREDVLMKIIEGQRIALEKHTEAVSSLTVEIQKNAEESIRAHGYVREEHNDMTKILQGIEKTLVSICAKS